MAGIIEAGNTYLSLDKQLGNKFVWRAIIKLEMLDLSEFVDMETGDTVITNVKVKNCAHFCGWPWQRRRSCAGIWNALSTSKLRRKWESWKCWSGRNLALASTMKCWVSWTRSSRTRRSNWPKGMLTKLRATKSKEEHKKLHQCCYSHLKLNCFV